MKEEYYPFVLIPHSITSINSLELPLPSKPIEPRMPTRNSGNYTTFFVIIFFVSIIILFFSKNIEIAFGFFIVFMAIFIYSFIKDNISNSNRFENATFEYNENKKLYEKEIINWQKKVEDTKKDISAREKYRQEKLYSVLRSIEKPTHPKFGQEGKCEYLLRNELFRKFPNNLIFDKATQYYSPDIIFYDPETNLHVDIEVDEPYTVAEGFFKPIHFENNRNDVYRNSKFKEMNWIVIRFAEEQVVNYTKECVNEVIRVVSEILPTYKRFYNENLIIPPIKHWTEA